MQWMGVRISQLMSVNIDVFLRMMKVQMHGPSCLSLFNLNLLNLNLSVNLIFEMQEGIKFERKH